MSGWITCLESGLTNFLTRFIKSATDVVRKVFTRVGASRLCLDFREALYCSLINNPQLLFLLAILGDYTRRSVPEHIHVFFILLFKDSPCDVENAVARRASEFFCKVLFAIHC